MSNEPSHAANFDENDYARPNQSWTCGWAAEGHACPLGPTRKGTCRSAHECAPYHQGDTWVCSRIKAKGGPCDEGPLPDGTCCRPIQKCQPVRSIMSRRGVVSLHVFAAAVGVALIMVAAPGRSRIISPGPLISAHRQAVDRCEDCHAAGDGKPSDWVRAAFHSRPDTQQSTLCLHCHAELGDNALHPHGQSIDALNALAGKNAPGPSEHRSLQVMLAKNVFDRPADARAELACATCHREHHGASDLTALTNQQCQVCHTADFHSFGRGHPALANYPYNRRTRIYFDHQTHFGRHFPDVDDQARHACRDCHFPDPAGRYMLARPFEETCAACHGGQIKDDTMSGLPVAAIPAVDVQTLQDAGFEIGQWPAIYPLHVEASPKLAPLHALIAPRRDDLRRAQMQLDGVDLADLSSATPEQLSRVESFIWAFKESLVDILAQGRGGLQADFENSLKDSLSAEQIEALVAAIPLSGIAAMQRRWLPHVVEEVAARRAGDELPGFESGEAASVSPLAGDVAAADDFDSRLLDSGWILHSPSMSLRYRPTRHADPLLKTLFDCSVLTRSQEMILTAGQPSNDPVDAPLAELFDSLASPFASGRCRKCHTFETGASPAETHMNWLTYRPPMAQHAFTRFHHAPHLAIQTNQACSRCHEFAGDDRGDEPFLRAEFVSNAAAPATVDFHSDFADMTKSNCADCHTAQSARDRCTTCHNYHVR